MLTKFSFFIGQNHISDIYCTVSAEVDDRRDGADRDNDECESAHHVGRAIPRRRMTATEQVVTRGTSVSFDPPLDV